MSWTCRSESVSMSMFRHVAKVVKTFGQQPAEALDELRYELSRPKLLTSFATGIFCRDGTRNGGHSMGRRFIVPMWMPPGSS